MAYDVLIKDKTTGEVRTCRMEFDWSDGCDFLWSEGNFGCDCNRGLFFAASKGNEDPEVECGETRFAIIGIISGGREVYPSEETDRPIDP